MVCTCYLWISLIAIVAVITLVIYFVSEKNPKIDIKGKNIVITGGSSGIGLSTAKELIKRGANSVAIIARTQRTLDEAKSSLESFSQKLNMKAKVYTYSADVSNEESMNNAISQYITEVKKIDVVVASAGVTNPNYFDDIPVSEFDRLMKINYIGTVVTVKAVTPHFKKNGAGRFVLVGSMAGLAGVHGYSAYSPTKFAVRGLVECLSMELKPYGISFSVCNPPDVDTPMYEEESKTKPEECKLISEGTGVFPPEQLANDICDGIENYKYFIQTGFDGIMVGLLTIGFGPAGNFTETLLQVCTGSIMRLVAIVYRYMYDDIVAKVYNKKHKNK